MILGIDEVGRGAWAGPLVVGAVVLGGAQIDGLTDSKALTKKRRELLNEQILAHAIGVGLGWVTASEIGKIGLGPALCLATKRAVQNVNASFHEIILDGTVNFLADTPLESYVTLMKKADLLIPSVSAASIVAKVARDRYMAELGEEYRVYKFGSHVGYGTAAHRAAIQQHGVSDEHRLSIAPLRRYTKKLEPKLNKKTKGLSFNRENKVLELKMVAKPTAYSTTRSIGDASETAAAEELMRQGHTIIARNWKTKFCEIDIVSKLGEVYYFSEVKHRKNTNSGDGLAAITPRKLSQMRYAAKFYLHSQSLDNADARLMAISSSGKSPTINDIVEIE